MTETGSGVVYDGVPLDGVEVRLDDDAEVWLRGPMLMRCYRDGSRPFDADGWLPTGDLGRWLDDGRLHVDGRRGDLIITGGENVWPEAVEAILAVASSGGRGDGARRRRRRVGSGGGSRDRAGGRRFADARFAPRRTSRSRTRRSWRPARSESSTRSPHRPRQTPPLHHVLVNLLRTRVRKKFTRTEGLCAGGDAGAAVDHVGLAGDPARPIAGEEHREVGDVLRLAEALHRQPGRQLLAEVVDEE